MWCSVFFVYTWIGFTVEILLSFLVNLSSWLVMAISICRLLMIVKVLYILQNFDLFGIDSFAEIYMGPNLINLSFIAKPATAGSKLKINEGFESVIQI